MASINKVILIGNLGADPEMRTTTRMATFHSNEHKITCPKTIMQHP